MSDRDDAKGRNAIRRFSLKDRKKQLPPAELIFPPDVDPVELASQAADAGIAPNIPDFDLDVLPMPDRDAEAQAVLSSLGPQHVRQLVIPPDSERFPPIEPKPSAKSLKQRPISDVVRPPNELRNNILTVLFSVGTILILAIYVTIWNDPQTALNPFPPDTPFVVITATSDNRAQSPVSTPPSQINSSSFPFIVAPESPLFVANSAPSGCNWASIGGTVIGLDGEPRDGLAIRIEGEDLDERVFSGSVQAFGAGGFEFVLGGAPTDGQYTVTLMTSAGVPLSEPFVVQMRADCNANVAIITFIQVEAF